MNLDDILVCITNHNDNENAIKLKSDFIKNFDTIIIDSKSDKIEDEFDVKLDNVYYSGLFNESVRQTKIRNKKYLYFIASDVFIDNVDVLPDLLSTLDDNIYLWAPSSRGQSHQHCKNLQSGGVRSVPYLEGFSFLSHLDCCDMIHPVDLDKNLFGFGIDLLLGYSCVSELGKRCVVDDRFEIYHKEGTGYNQGRALQDMYNWMLSNFDDRVKEYTILYSKEPGYKELLKYLEK